MRLAALNHGTIRSRIPGREHQVVAQKLRWVGGQWSARFVVSEEPTNPTVSIQLSGVDTEGHHRIGEDIRQHRHPPVQDSADAVSSRWASPSKTRCSCRTAFLWRGSKRSCDVLFTNVRTSARRIATVHRRLEADHRLPVRHRRALAHRGPGPGRTSSVKRTKRQRTLVWLPSFFSTRTQAELGQARHHRPTASGQ